MSVHKPPRPFPLPLPDRSVFLAGSIEMGQAEDWQARASKQFEAAHFAVLNPRRDDWDASWVQRMDNPQFMEQVTWELDGLDAAHDVLLNLIVGTKSPISLLELGLYARTGRLTVCCPEGFWRKGNVEIVCARHRVPIYECVDSAVEAIIAEAGMD